MFKVGDQVIITRVDATDRCMGVHPDTICLVSERTNSMLTLVPISGRARTLYVYPDQVRKF